MLNKTQLCGAIIALIASSSVWAADQTLTLNDGREVILHDNFTWQYKHQTNTPQTKQTLNVTTETPVIATSAAAILLLAPQKELLLNLVLKKQSNNLVIAAWIYCYQLHIIKMVHWLFQQ